MMFQRIVAVVLALIVCVAAIEGGVMTKKRSVEEYGEGYDSNLARVGAQQACFTPHLITSWLGANT